MGVHAAFFASAAGLDDVQLRSTVAGGAEDGCWGPVDTALVAMCDALHRDCDIPTDLWRRLKVHFRDEAILELLMLAGPSGETASRLLIPPRAKREAKSAC